MLTEMVRDILHNDCRCTVREICDQIGASFSAVQRILADSISVHKMRI